MSPAERWTWGHSNFLAKALTKILGEPTDGTMAFIRCLTPDIVDKLARDHDSFRLDEWRVYRVSALGEGPRTITPDHAVALRESKGSPVLLLVDTSGIGAGMDGIFNAALEVPEQELLEEAQRRAASELTKRITRKHREYAEKAVGKARGIGGRHSVSPWTVYDFFCQVAANGQHAGSCLHLLGLWPIAGKIGKENDVELEQSQRLVAHFFNSGASGLMPRERINAVRLLDPTDEQLADLERFVRTTRTEPRQDALAGLADKNNLWVNNLRLEDSSTEIRSIILTPWRGTTGKLLKWSGLIETVGSNELPRLVVDPDPGQDKSKLEVRWKTRPDGLPKGTASYRVSVLTKTGEEELAYKEVVHGTAAQQRCVFVGEDFATLPEDAKVAARIKVAVVGAEPEDPPGQAPRDEAVDLDERKTVAPVQTEEFEITFGEALGTEAVAGGRVYRTFAEGLIELGNRQEVELLTAMDGPRPKDARGAFLTWRSPNKRIGFRVHRPPLIKEVEDLWQMQGDVVGRWRVKVRASGERVGQPVFMPFHRPDGVAEKDWARMKSACKKLIARFGDFGGVGQVYDDGTHGFEVVKEYLRAWTALLYGEAHPQLALGNTVEVQSQSGRMIGLIVLPSHPLRMAWHVAYDNLVLHAAFDDGLAPKDIRDEFKVLDGAMFPAMLPGLESNRSTGPDPHTFVFADTLGFHAVGMVPDTDKEPKATVAVLRRALGDKEDAKGGTVPQVGTRSADVLGNEVLKYVECHSAYRTLHVHALRAGDGRTVARALGKASTAVDKMAKNNLAEASPDVADTDADQDRARLAFVLELYPSAGSREAGVVGRFIAECQERRRRRAGTIHKDDRWLLESLTLPGGISVPRLRWARKDDGEPKEPAHLAIAFDTFESSVEADDAQTRIRPFHAFGLLSFFDRSYQGAPVPNWRSAVPTWKEGDKHPGDRTHTDRLMRLQNHVQRLVVRSLGLGEGIPVLRTCISSEKEDDLVNLHKLCDWVVTLDRNAGIEYFDSPRDNRDIYDAYVIDCVPEREDLGCLQLITSTTNLAEVQGLLEGALDGMGLSRSPRNAKFLIEQLKALSGRLAIRLTGSNTPASELIALALVQANCADNASGLAGAGLGNMSGHECWTPLQDGFFVPVDDVCDLLPPLDASTGPRRGIPRPDLIYVTDAPRKGLLFRFVEVKYRRHLRTARSPEVLGRIRRQTESLRQRWFAWYGRDVPPSFRAVRRAKLARVLRFYADKAHRHDLTTDRHRTLVAEIDRMVGKGDAYAFADDPQPAPDLGWVFCPDHQDPEPQLLSPPNWDVKVYLFGPGGLPDLDSGYRRKEPLAQVQTVVPAVKHPDLDLPPEEDVQSLEPPHQTAPTEPVQEDGDRRPPMESAVVLGTDRYAQARVEWQLTVRGNPHLLVAGLPGMGKTTCLLNLCRQMLDAGVRPIVFSYHEDLDEKLDGMVDSIRFIDFDGLGFNPLQVPDRRAHRPYLEVAGMLRDIFLAIYPGLGDLQAEAVRSAVKDSFVEAGWAEPGAQTAELAEPPFKRVYEILAEQEQPDRGLTNLLTRLEELNDYGLFDVGQVHGSLWESREPTVIRIHRTQSDVLQNAFSSLVLYGLYKDMFRRGMQDRITHAVIFDEAHRAAKLNVIPTMAKECRKYGVSLVLASQEARDFHKSVFSAIANYLVLRLTDADAKTLVRNVADSRQEKALIDTIKQMNRFRALYFQEGKTRPNHVDLLNYTDSV